MSHLCEWFKQIKPNFIFVVGVLAAIVLQVMGWVPSIADGTKLVISDGGEAYIHSVLALALSIMTLVIGGLVAVMQKLLEGPPPPPEVTEETLIKVLAMTQTDEASCPDSNVNGMSTSGGEPSR